MQDIIDNTANIVVNTDDIIINEAYIINNALNISTNTADILLRALINGDASELFSVANSTLSTHAVNQSQVIGIAQTWQDVSASRAVSTSYQNTTGKPIQVAITASSAGTVPIEASTDGSTWVPIGKVNADMTFIIPNNYYYRVNGGATITYWAELR